MYEQFSKKHKYCECTTEKLIATRSQMIVAQIIYRTMLIKGATNAQINYNPAPLKASDPFLSSKTDEGGWLNSFFSAQIIRD